MASNLKKVDESSQTTNTSSDIHIRNLADVESEDMVDTDIYYFEPTIEEAKSIGAEPGDSDSAAESDWNELVTAANATALRSLEKFINHKEWKIVLDNFENDYQRYHNTIGQLFYSNDKYEDLKGNEYFIGLPDSLLLALKNAFTLRRQSNENTDLTAAFYDTLLLPLKDTNNKDWHPFLVLAYLEVMLEYIEDCDDYQKAKEPFVAVETMLREISIWLTKISHPDEAFLNFLDNLSIKIPLDSEFYETETSFEQSREHVFLTIGELSAFNNSSDLQDTIVERIRAVYRFQPPIDGGSGTRLDSMGRINHYGSASPFYENMMKTLEADIYKEIEALPIQDIAKLFFDINEVAFDWIKEVESWKEFKSNLLKSDDLAWIIREEIMGYFFRLLPTYVGEAF